MSSPAASINSSINPSSIGNSIGNKFSSSLDTLKQNKPVYQAAVYIGVCGLIILIIVIIKNLIVYSYTQKMRKPWLIKGSKDAKKSLVIAQDPADPNSVPLNRSDNEVGGTEFTYSLWFVVDNFVYNKDKWKHVFHKGNNPPYPNRAPGVYLHPNKNSLRIYMNTYEKILEYVDIDNIPVRKWIHLGIVLKEKILDVYVNGLLKKRHVFDSLPRQNFGDVWINLNGGFEGYISKMRYFQYALNYNDIENIVEDGPSDDTCGGDKDLPGYLNDKWWMK
jgi:hypothetical protein